MPILPPEPAQHPAWCDLTRCEATLGYRGAHSSKPAVVAADKSASGRLQFRLWQAEGHPVYLEVVAGNHDEGHSARLDLTPRQAVQARLILAQLLNQVHDDKKSRNERPYPPNGDTHR